MISKLFLAAIACATMIGCATEAAKPATSAEPSASSTVVMEKCGLCGKEVPKAELASHDGKMACKACIVAHNH